MREHALGFAAQYQAGQTSATVGSHDNQIALQALRGRTNRVVRTIVLFDQSLARHLRLIRDARTNAR